MARRVVVVKLGSSILVDARGRARRAVFDAIAAQTAELADAGTPVVLVSSGAIALGLGALSRPARPRRLHELQAASAVGQSILQRSWAQALRRHGADAAQVLLTSGDLHRRDGYVNARGTLEALLRWGLVPVVNENDSTATDEITFGDNDALAAQVAVLMRARLLVLLTDTAGLYDRDPSQPGARLLEHVDDHRMLEGLQIDGRGSAWGSGGMRSKVVAAEMARSGGAAVVIAGGHTPGVVADAAAGRAVGTRFRAEPSPLSAYKLWVRYGRPVRGRLTLDAGAARAVRSQGRSLLPVGVTAVEGSFQAGDVVELAAPDGERFAVGVSGYAPAALRSAAGRRGAVEAVHRDNLVLL
ncbi:MAG: glutamate 5-kinase [Gaiellales bacterium]